MDTRDLLFRIQTIKTGSIRTLVEAIKDLLQETNFEIDEHGLRIKSMNGTHSTLVQLNLIGSTFDEFYCAEKRIFGVNMINLHKLIKTVNNNETIVISMKRSDTTKIMIDIMNSQKQMVTHFSLLLMDLDIDSIEIPQTMYPSIITIDSSDFQKIIRDMYSLGEIVDIQSTYEELVFRCKGDFAEQETTYSLRERSDDEEVTTEIVQGQFLLKELQSFTKCTSLAPTLKMYLQNDLPIVIEYDVAGLGTIKMALAPKHVPTTSI
jgi:proliferating cell nuclear antigen